MNATTMLRLYHLFEIGGGIAILFAYQVGAGKGASRERVDKYLFFSPAESEAILEPASVFQLAHAGSPYGHSPDAAS